MTSPDDANAEVERVPLKVVPIFVTAIEEPEAVEPEVVVEPEPEAAPRRRTPWVAVAAGILALGTVGVHVAALVVATDGRFELGTILGYVAIGLSALAVLTGIAAAIVGRLRGWAVAAAVLGLVANPYLLLLVLRSLSGASG